MADASAYRRLTFNVVTETPLPVGEQVFISGEVEALGRWAPDGLPLTRVDDRVWTSTVDVPADRPVEFKITRGTWEAEEVSAGGIVPPNRVLRPGGDRAMTFRVRRWKDRPPVLDRRAGAA